MQTKWKCLTRENAINFGWWWYIFNFLSWWWEGQFFTKTKENKDIHGFPLTLLTSTCLRLTRFLNNIYLHWLPRYPEGLKRFENLVSEVLKSRSYLPTESDTCVFEKSPYMKIKLSKTKSKNGEDRQRCTIIGQVGLWNE